MSTPTDPDANFCAHQRFRVRFFPGFFVMEALYAPLNFLAISSCTLPTRYFLPYKCVWAGYYIDWALCDYTLSFGIPNDPIPDYPTLCTLLQANRVPGPCDGGNMSGVQTVDNEGVGVGIKDTVTSTATAIRLKSLTSNDNTITITDNPLEIDLSVVQNYVTAVLPSAVPGVSLKNLIDSTPTVTYLKNIVALNGTITLNDLNNLIEFSSSKIADPITPANNYVNTDGVGVEVVTDTAFNINLANPAVAFNIQNLVGLASTNDAVWYNVLNNRISYAPAVSSMASADSSVVITPLGNGQYDLSAVGVGGGNWRSLDNSTTTETVPVSTTQEIHTLTVPANTLTALGQRLTHKVFGAFTTTDALGGFIFLNTQWDSVDVTPGGLTITFPAVPAGTGTVESEIQLVVTDDTPGAFLVKGYISAIFRYPGNDHSANILANLIPAFDPTLAHDIGLGVTTPFNSDFEGIWSKLWFDL